MQDILRMRVRTTSVSEIVRPVFPLDVHIALSRAPPFPPSQMQCIKEVCVISVGGSRAERRKWMHVMDGLSGLLVCFLLPSLAFFFSNARFLVFPLPFFFFPLFSLSLN